MKRKWKLLHCSGVCVGAIVGNKGIESDYTRKNVSPYSLLTASKFRGCVQASVLKVEIHTPLHADSIKAALMVAATLLFCQTFHQML